MIFGTKQYKNGKRVGHLVFDSGKRVFLNKLELLDLENKIREWNWSAIEKEHYNNKE